MSRPVTTPQIRTTAQIEAADPKSSVWVSANAGTGKTQVLTDRITRLLLDNVKPEKILCLTFTKSAASEMATRIFERLGSWTVATNEELTDEISALTGKTPNISRLKQARRLFAETLDAPGGFKIRTIHAFCESLLGRFPLESGISPNFSVIDEHTTYKLIHEARDVLLNKTFQADTEDITNSLTVMAGLLNEEGFINLINDLSSEHTRLRSLFKHYGKIEAVIDALRNSLEIKKNETRESIIDEALFETTNAVKKLINATEALSQGAKTDKILGKKIQKCLKPNHFKLEEDFLHYQKIFLTQNGSKRISLMTKKLAEANPNLLQNLREEQSRIESIYERLQCMNIFTASKALIQLGHRLLEIFNQLKQARALLDYDDLILKTRDLLLSEGGQSWVHYKLDGGIDHILVDEAQDTSPEQWDVIKALTGDFFSGLGAQGGERTIFAVGDEKQSIYSFQGADPFMFGQTSEYFSNMALNAGKRFKSVELERSYRSTKSILKAVDKVFENEVAHEGLTFNRKPITHHTERHGQGGLVELWPIIKKEDSIEIEPWTAPLDRHPVDSPEDKMAVRIADTIKSWLENEEILSSASRPIQESDIMILVRRRGSFAEKMVNTLKQKRIPVAGTDRMLLTEQLAVMDLLAIGQFALLPEDDLTLAVILKGPLFGFSDNDDLFPLAYQRQSTLWAALRKASRCNSKYRNAYDRLSELLARADFMPPYEFYAHILGPDGGRRDLLARLGQEADDPIDEFLNLTLDYEREYVPCLQGFMSWINNSRIQIKRDMEQGRGEVRVMTIHGSKGLQGNIVFLPDTCSLPDYRHDPKLHWVHGDQPTLFWTPTKDFEEKRTTKLASQNKKMRTQEYRRLLYVAMTRARDRLYIGGWEGKHKSSPDCWYNLIKNSFEIITNEKIAPSQESILRLSNHQKKDPDSKISSPNINLDNVSSKPSWVAKKIQNELSKEKFLKPSKFPDEENPSNCTSLFTKDGKSFKRGNLIHHLLETLPNLKPNKWDEVMSNYLALPIHQLNSFEQNTIAKDVLRVMKSREYGNLFGPKALTEVPVIGKIGGHVMTGRIDRLEVTKDQINFIDYKTNRAPPKEVHNIPSSYLNQMAIYRALLKKIYPNREVNCIIGWTDVAKLMNIPSELLDRHTP